MSQSNNSFWQSPLGLAIVAGIFTLSGIFLTSILNQSDSTPADKVKTGPTLAKLKADEQQRKYSLVKNCKQTAKGRFEAARLAPLLLNAVKTGTQIIRGNGQADMLCRNSKFVDSTNLDTSTKERFVWLGNTTSDDAKVICQCWNSR